MAKIRGINIVGAKAFSESELIDQFVLRTPGLAHLVHQARPLLAREASPPTSRRCARSTRTAATSTSASSPPRCQITPDRHGHLHHGQHHRGREVHRHRRQASAARCWCRARSWSGWCSSRPATCSRARSSPRSTKAITDRLGNDGYAFANANADPGRRQGKAHGGVQHRRSTRAGASTCGASTSRATPRRATRWCGARCASSRRVLRRLEDPALAPAHRPHQLLQRGQRRDPAGRAAAPTRSTSLYSVKERPTGALLFGARLLQRREAGAVGLDDAGERLRHRQLPLASTSTAAASTRSIRCPTSIPTAPSTASARASTSTAARPTPRSSRSAPTPPIRYGGGVKFGYPISENSRIDIGPQRGAGAARHLRQPARCSTSTSSTSSATSTPTARCTAGWARDTRDSLIQTNARRAHARHQRDRRLATCSTTASATSSSTTVRSTAHLHALRCARRRLRRRATATSRCRSSRTTTPAAPDRCAATARSRSARRTRSGNVLGGNRKITGSAEILFPMPGAQQDKSLRLAWFVDGGQRLRQPATQLDDLRYSTGLALRLVLAVRSAAAVVRAAAEREEHGPHAEATIHLRHRVLKLE